MKQTLRKIKFALFLTSLWFILILFLCVVLYVNKNLAFMAILFHVGLWPFCFTIFTYMDAKKNNKSYVEYSEINEDSSLYYKIRSNGDSCLFNYINSFDNQSNSISGKIDSSYFNNLNNILNYYDIKKLSKNNFSTDNEIKQFFVLNIYNGLNHLHLKIPNYSKTDDVSMLQSETVAYLEIIKKSLYDDFLKSPNIIENFKYSYSIDNIERIYEIKNENSNYILSIEVIDDTKSEETKNDNLDNYTTSNLTETEIEELVNNAVLGLDESVSYEEMESNEKESEDSIITKELSKEELEELSNIIINNKVLSWNHNSLSSKVEYEIEITNSSESTFTNYSENKVPNNFNEVHNLLIDFLEKRGKLDENKRRN